jgi:hypothetical protein
MASRKLRATGTAIALVCFTGLVSSSQAQAQAASGKVPELDMRPGCQAVASQELDLADKPTVQSCLDEEQVARHQLEGIWSTFSASDRRDCTAGVQTDGPPSYINLLWCLQDAKTAHEFEQNPTPQNAPVSDAGSDASGRM